MARPVCITLLLSAMALPAQQQQADRDAQEILRLENESRKNVNAGLPWLPDERHVRKELKCISRRGELMDIRQLTEAYARIAGRIHERPSEQSVEVFGDTAVATGVGDVTIDAQERPGEAFRYRYMDVWSRNRGVWQLAACSETPIQPRAQQSAAPPNGAPEPPQDEAAIRKMLADTAQAFNNADVNGVLRLATADVDQNAGGELVRVGAADLKQMFSEYPNETRTYTMKQIRFIRPDVAIVDTRADVRSRGQILSSGVAFLLVKNTGAWLTSAARRYGISADDSGSGLQKSNDQEKSAQSGISGFAGTWKEDLSKAVTKPFKNFMALNRTEDGNLKFAPLGGKAFTYALDGKAHPDPDPAESPGTMVSWKQLTDSTLVTTVTKNGHFHHETTRTVSPDGKTLTAVSRARMPDGKLFSDTRVWKRVSDETSGVWGKWQLVSFKSDVPDVLVISVPDTDTITVSVNKEPFTFTAKIDGKDYPATAPNTSSKITVSVSRINNSTLVQTLKVDGKPVQDMTFVLSPDKRTLSEEDREPGSDAVVGRQVFDRQ